MNKNALIVFVRKPELGKVKTRLAATVGNAAALDIYKKLLQHTFELTQATTTDKFIFYAGEIVEEDIWREKRYTKLLQQETDLGGRMKAAFHTVFQSGYDKVVIIGSDCPQLTPSHLADAFKALNQVDIVIGPASDGGYYLLGMKKLQGQLFQGIEWSTPTVFAKTEKIINQLGCSYHALETLTDVDEEKDLPEEWRKDIIRNTSAT
jgi:hypothetical protein